MARARKPHVVRLTADAFHALSPRGESNTVLADRTNVAAPPPCFRGVYLVPNLPRNDPVPAVAYWAVLADWVRKGYRVDPPFAPRPAPGRRDLDATWAYLDGLGWDPPRGRNGRPVIPTKMPSPGDGAARLSVVERIVRDADLSNLTLPRLFARRCEFHSVDFWNTDLSESRLGRNEFIDCDFRGAHLSHADLRASVFRGCKFGKAVLGGADLRRATVSRCTFRGADLWGAIADYLYAGSTDFPDRLTPKQRAAMEWHEDPGEEPDSA